MPLNIKKELNRFGACFPLICKALQSPFSDTELWKEFTGGSGDAYSQLFRRFYPRLYQYGVKIVNEAEVVEDAVQELFLEIWQKPPALIPQSVQAYLLQALKFKLYKHFRQNKAQNNETTDEPPFGLSPETLHVKKEEDAERLSKIYAVLAQLSPRQREIIYLKIYKVLSYEEVSEVMQLNYQGVRNLLSQALKAFRELYPLER